MVPVSLPPKMTTSLALARPCEKIALHARAASGDPITITRSPGSIVSSPRATIIRSPLMMLATFESGGMAASRNL